MLCRGLFTPVNDVIETKFQHHVYTAAFLPWGEPASGGSGGDCGGYPLADAFAEVIYLLTFSLGTVNDDLLDSRGSSMCSSSSMGREMFIHARPSPGPDQS